MSSTGDSRSMDKCHWRQTDVAVNQVGGGICEFSPDSYCQKCYEEKIDSWSSTSYLIENI